MKAADALYRVLPMGSAPLARTMTASSSRSTKARRRFAPRTALSLPPRSARPRTALFRQAPSTPQSAPARNPSTYRIFAPPFTDFLQSVAQSAAFA